MNAEIAGRISESRRFSDQQMVAADRYAQELLARLEQQLEAFRQSVRSGLDQLEAPPAEPGAPAGRARNEAVAALPVTPNGGAGNGHGGGHEHSAGHSRSTLGTLMGPDAEAAADGEPPEAEQALIDDFAMPPLDDQPGGAVELPPELRDEQSEDGPEQPRLDF